jgi:hypothetical protein
MFDFWFESPPLLRAMMGLVMLGIAVLIWSATAGRMYAYGLGVVGLIFLMACNAGNTEAGTSSES